MQFLQDKDGNYSMARLISFIATIAAVTLIGWGIYALFTGLSIELVSYGVGLLIAAMGHKDVSKFIETKK